MLAVCYNGNSARRIRGRAVEKNHPLRSGSCLIFVVATRPIIVALAIGRNGRLRGVVGIVGAELIVRTSGRVEPIHILGTVGRVAIASGRIAVQHLNYLTCSFLYLNYSTSCLSCQEGIFLFADFFYSVYLVTHHGVPCGDFPLDTNILSQIA